MSKKTGQELPQAIDPVAKSMMDGAADSTEESRVGTLEMIAKSLMTQEKNRVARLAFEVNPQNNSGEFGALYRGKMGLTPDNLIKRITGPQGDELVNQVLQARANHAASFGRPRTSRFAIGFDFQEMNPAQAKNRSPEESAKLKDRMEKAKKVMWSCGYGPVDDEPTAMNLSQLLKQVTRDGLRFGRLAMERIYKNEGGKEVFWAFRPADAGTIYKILAHKEKDKSARIEALRLLAKLKNEKFDPSNYSKDEYKWTQVIDGRPIQGFTEKEMVVYNLYPVTDVEYNGYPLTPIDQALNAITTHISITMHNRLYFQNGRAARGMLIFRSDSLDESAVQKIRLQFHQSINSVTNSWRMPVFAVGQEDNVQWEQLDVSGRDAEFQYLMDNNARVILSAFQMSPEELPGYAHLARGTNSQALSESGNEYKLTAARDVGLRPLLYDLQDCLNTHILPLIDKELAETHQLVFAGLEKDDPEKESTRLQQDMNVHLSYNDILEQVEKPKLPKSVGGEMPLNPQYRQQAIDPFLTVGQILEFFYGVADATKDPRYNYVRDPFWVQNQQLIMQKAQMAMQNQMMQQQAAMQQQMGSPPPEQQSAQPGASPEEKQAVQAENTAKTEQWLAQNYELLDKSIKNNHSELSKAILKRHQELVDSQMKKFNEDSKKAMEEIGRALGKKKE